MMEQESGWKSMELNTHRLATVNSLLVDKQRSPSLRIEHLRLKCDIAGRTSSAAKHLLQN